MSRPAAAAALDPIATPFASARRVAFVVLLAATPFLPHLSTSPFTFPAVSNVLALVPFAALMLLPLVDRKQLRRLANLDLVVLLAALVPLGLEDPPRQWPVMLVYPILAYLAIRMLVVARFGRAASAAPGTAVGSRAVLLPRSWLVVGIAVLALVHVSWTVGSRVSTDIGIGSVRGALSLVHGQPLYGTETGPDGVDPHTDTYGPINYEAYIPFAAITDARSAARLTALLFDLLTAALLFVLGRRMRDGTLGIVLAFSWLAFPLTLYGEVLGLNDSIVAASLVAVLLAGLSASRRGVFAAIAGWAKLSPLALVPLLAGQPGASGRERKDVVKFLAWFVVATALVFAPALLHSSPATFISRTFGFQSGRAPSESLWSSLQISYGAHLPWLAVMSKVLHGLLATAVGTLALLAFWVRRRADTIGLAAASAAILFAVQACLNYYAYGYFIWAAPLVLVATVAAQGDR